MIAGPTSGSLPGAAARVSRRLLTQVGSVVSHHLEADRASMVQSGGLGPRRV